jgi:hypothetical protein
LTAPIAPSRVDDEVYDLEKQVITNAQEAGKKALTELKAVRDDTLLGIEKYMLSQHPGPYVPREADEEYKLLAKRSVDNWVRLVPKTTAQALYVEGHRLSGQSELSPAWKGWQRNRLDSRQTWLYMEACSYNYAFAAVAKDTSGVEGLDGLAKVYLFSPLDTAALYVDPVNDARPALVVHVDTWPADKALGTGRMWDRENIYQIEFNDEFEIKVSENESHGCSDTPVILFTPWRDLTGRPQGQVQELLRPQDRINQVNFDTLIVSTYGSFKIRYVTGMVPPPKRVRQNVTYQMALDEDLLDDAAKVHYESAGTAPTAVVAERWITLKDEEGKPIPDPIRMSPKDLMILAAPDAKVGTLDGTPLDGYIKFKDSTVKDFAAQAQFPVHLLTGNISNLAADALAVAEGNFWRMIAMMQHSYGESWEQVLQLIAEVESTEGADDFDTEVAWRDMSSRSVGSVVDALGKGAQMLGIPPRALWPFFPGATGGTVLRWEEMAGEMEMDHMAGPEASFGRSVSPANQSWISRAPVDDGGDSGNPPP